MAFDTIVFDLDGTLVDTAPDLTASLNHALRQLGRPEVDPPSVRQMVGRGARALVIRGLEATGGLTEEMVDAGFDAFMQHYRANPAVHSVPFDGVEQALDQLAAMGLRLAVCTNKPAELAHMLIAELGWQQRFAALLGGDSLPVRKPDPLHLEQTITEAGGQRAIFVGDSETDADTAKAAGVPLILVSFGYATQPLDGMGSIEIIEHYRRLPGAVADIQATFKQ